MLGMLIHYYAPVPTCRLNMFFIAWTLILGIITTLLSARMPGLLVSWVCTVSHGGT